MTKPPHGFDLNLWFHDGRHDMMAAAMILTRIPVPWPEDLTPNTARSYWAFPLIGIAVAILPVFFGTTLAASGLPLMAAAAVMLLGIILLTGGLHQDGLADLADGLGGRDAQHRLQIMRDSSIGSFGTLALIIFTMITIACLMQIGAHDLTLMAQSMMAVAAMSRGMMGLQRWLHPTPDKEGLAAVTGQPERNVMIIGMVISFLLGAIFLSISHVLGMMAVGVLITLLLGRFMMSWLGGVNGDGLGATQQCTEATMLMALTIMLAA